MKSGYYTYLIRAGNTLYHKIGIAKNVNKRLKCLQTGCPERITVITITEHKSVKEARIHEKEILERYKDNKTCGEWFVFKDKCCANCRYGKYIKAIGERVCQGDFEVADFEPEDFIDDGFSSSQISCNQWVAKSKVESLNY
ncbi:hypothetical protein LCGC14_1858640 [marine sediment metagenome]|uniref:GIY-YIG domain-containing protein n=1 Tax=marine sediment metagenome TaxID=412755 RepID=A0A0F9GWM0_9ZZZZ